MNHNNMNLYDDIIHLPHHVSKRHPQMSMKDRAAQFSPFAALTGHGAAIAETARLTDEKMYLDDEMLKILDEKLFMIMAHEKEQWNVKVVYFQKDEKKEGGEYREISGTVEKLYPNERMLKINGILIGIRDIIDIEIMK